MTLNKDFKDFKDVHLSFTFPVCSNVKWCIVKGLITNRTVFSIVQLVFLLCLCITVCTFSMRHLYSPGTVKRVWVEIRKTRRENRPSFTKNIASTKSWRKTRQKTYIFCDNQHTLCSELKKGVKS